MKWQRTVQRGFTLIEILVVIAILAILGALVVPKIMSRPDEARVAAAHQDVQAVMQALKIFGTTKAPRMARMAMTTRISISVKPRCTVRCHFIAAPLQRGVARRP